MKHKRYRYYVYRFDLRDWRWSWIAENFTGRKLLNMCITVARDERCRSWFNTACWSADHPLPHLVVVRARVPRN